MAEPLRTKLARAALSAIDLRRRPPDEQPSEMGLRAALAALRRPPTPRTLSFLTVKRINPRFGDTSGHWWVEVDGVESYGWWPAPRGRLFTFLFGAKGMLNGGVRFADGRRSARDPHHRDRAPHEFHPRLVVRKSDRRVRREIRSFADRFEGRWRWSTKPETRDCRRFQLALFEAVGLDDHDHADTRGNGCPFLALFRSRRRALSP
jgi:hypothetical protein